MSKFDPDIGLLPSVLDRLLDDDPQARQDRPSSLQATLGQIKSAVARDLETLLNTRREIQEDLPAEFHELHTSLVVYGLPDFIALSLLNPNDRKKIRRSVEQVVAAFEPRLKSARVTIEPRGKYDAALHFRIDAILEVQPVREQVVFDAVLQLNTYQYQVQGG